MQVLIINGFEDSKRGNSKYNLFHNLVKNVINTSIDCKISGNINYICRNINELGEYTCDWMHDSLTQENQYNTKLFDKIDVIFVSGDMTTLPWEPKAMQLVKLMHMANQTEKCVCSIGMGAFSLLYSTATNGSTFNILNGPDGGSTSDLPYFTQYGLSDVKRQKYPSGYLDNETGDMYTYNVNTKSWVPVCNTGIFKIAKTGMPSSTKLQPPSKKFSSTNHVLSDQLHLDVDPETIESNQTIVYITTKYLQNYIVKKIQNRSFVTNVIPNWYAHQTPTLPAGYGFQAIAESEKGSIILLKDNKLLLFMDETSKNQQTNKIIEMILKSFIAEMVERMSFERIDVSLTKLLFRGNTGFNSNKKINIENINIFKLAEPIRSQVVGSLVQRGEDCDLLAVTGPDLIETPNFDILFNNSTKTTTVNYYALQPESKRLSTTEGRPVPRVTRDAGMNHMSRLDRLLQKSGNNIGKLMAVKDAVFARQDSEQRGRARMAISIRDQEENCNNANPNPNPSPSPMSRASSRASMKGLGLGLGNASASASYEGEEEEEEGGDEEMPATAKAAEEYAYIFRSSGKRYVISNPHTSSSSGGPTKVHAQPQLKDINRRLDADTQKGGLTAVKECVEGKQASFLLPHFHPQPHRHPGVAHSTKAPEAKESKKSSKAQHRGGGSPDRFSKKVPKEEPAYTEEQPKGAVYIPLRSNGAVQRPYSSFKNIERELGRRREQGAEEYKGVYTEVYMSDFERQNREYNETKRGFLSEIPFLRHFGKRSAPPLREEGQIAGKGAFPLPPQAPQQIGHLPAKDWAILRSEDKSKRIDPDKTWMV